ncbi:MAG: FAD-dependent oxidoreductase [Thermoanaerobaculia bacterium]|nr:FAD-dependent oxidoreductase [Thermoanaerobaculia bacterium]
MTQIEHLPIAIVGAGPIGLAAAANLIERGMSPLILEAGSAVAASMRGWGHVRLFTPWAYLIDPPSRRLLEKHTDWQPPVEDHVPLARELVEQFFDPLAGIDGIAENIRLNTKVTAITKDGHDRMKNGTREQAPFLIGADTPEGPRRYLARAVIDTSGTWTTPNPLGAGGVEADGEEHFQDHIRYGMPDILGEERERYVGKRTLVVGSGHSAIGSVLHLAELAESEPNTQVAWAVRKKDPRKLWGGGEADEIAERGKIGTRVAEAVHSGVVTLFTGLSISAVREYEDGIEVVDVDGQGQVVVDEIVVAAGSRPDLDMLRELRLDLDVATEAAKDLGTMIDPNYHSCGTVKPHGWEELKHPEEGFFIAGMKAYGRAPTFLLRTGYEQVRSIVAHLAGDDEAAGRIELVLPETGVCSTDLAVDALSGKVPAGRCC